MKKILALVLAVAMLSATAFAATVEITAAGASFGANPGDTLTISPDQFHDVATATNHITLGKDYRFSTENFTLSAQKFDKGAALVASVKINDDDNNIKIVLKDSTELARPESNKAANLVIKEISVKAKKSYNGANTAYDAAGDFKKGNTYTFAVASQAATSKNVFVGYELETVNLNNAPSYLTNGKMAKFSKNSSDVVYETVSYSTGDVYIEGRVYDGDKVYINTDYDVNKDVLKANPDAAIRFVNIKTSGLPTSNTLQLTADEKEFVYKIVDGKLVESGLKWSADDYTWNGKIRTSTSFVISDIKLNAVAAGDGTTANPNPDTGANDVVGIAAALAVVSLVAAGAVSMKK